VHSWTEPTAAEPRRAHRCRTGGRASRLNGDKRRIPVIFTGDFTGATITCSDENLRPSNSTFEVVMSQ
jgi:hypothetical protein